MVDGTMISAKVDCVDVNDFFSSSNSEDFSFFPQSVQFRDADNLLGLWVFVFFCVFGLGFLVEFVIGALGEFLAWGSFCCNRHLFFK